MAEIQNTKQFDLEDRTQKYARRTLGYCKSLPKDMTNFEIAKQLIRSAGSVGANYIEANESLSRRDYFHRVKICRKEVKESRYWLNLTDPQAGLVKERDILIGESNELMRIFGAIIEKSK